MKKILLSLSLSFILIFTIIIPTLANTSPTTNRLAGYDRYETASQIAKSGWSQSDYSILAYGENYPDALASAPLAKKYNAPILLTTSNILPSTTKQTLTSLKVKNVFIIGGTGVISSSIDSELQSMGIIVTRIFGQDKYDTAIKVAEQLAIPSAVFVCTGEDYPDALSVAPIASMKQLPIILVSRDSVPDSVKSYLSSNNITKTYVIGYSDIVSDNVCNQLPNPERIVGGDKYARNIAVNQKFNNEFKSDSICVATGEGFADALTGTAYSAKISEPIILINNDSPLNTKSYYQKRLDNASNVYVFGGTGIISDTVIQNLNMGDTVLPVTEQKGSEDLGDTVTPISEEKGSLFKGVIASTKQQFLKAYERKIADADELISFANHLSKGKNAISAWDWTFDNDEIVDNTFSKDRILADGNYILFQTKIDADNQTNKLIRYNINTDLLETIEGRSIIFGSIDQMDKIQNDNILEDDFGQTVSKTEFMDTLNIKVLLRNDKFVLAGPTMSDINVNLDDSNVNTDNTNESTGSDESNYKVGQTYSLYCAAAYGTLTWSSSNTDTVSIINTNGQYCTIKCLKEGTVTIIAYVHSSELLYDPVLKIFIRQPKIEDYVHYDLNIRN
ncbi:MAG: hypothetical protein APF81_23840 [Desulfosporosinus sp. BRH_c37]|nr:MAG: hypothetical protein APF81_23840 [Desulfosporosinus sp. BRH_c37]